MQINILFCYAVKAPNITTQLEDLTLRKDETAILKCAIQFSEFCACKLEWFKDDRLLRVTDNVCFIIFYLHFLNKQEWSYIKTISLWLGL